MKYIKTITPQEFNRGLWDFYDVASKEEFWEVKGAYAFEHYLCWATLDNKCYFCFDTKTSMFVYFALEKTVRNIRALSEVFYEIVKAGFPFIGLLGRIGRYPRILKVFGHFSEPRLSEIEGKEEIIWFAGHPDTLESIKRRFM